jgi:hypothetical protein
MFRKLLLASAAGLALLSPLAFASNAEAREFRHEFRHEHCYRVYYRESCEGRWCFGGEFHGRRAAERFAESYRCRGFEVSVR